jgi:hypothetical protein
MGNSRAGSELYTNFALADTLLLLGNRCNHLGLIEQLLDFAFGAVAKVFDQIRNCLRDLSLSCGARRRLPGQELRGI